MVEYSKSSKHLFSISDNSVLSRRGGGEEEETLDYVEDGSKPIPVAKYRDGSQYLRLDINSTSVIGMFGPSGSGKTTGDMSIVTRAYSRGRIPVNLADIDLHTTNLDNNGGVSKELINAMGFYPGEERGEIPQKTVIPKYLLNQMNDRQKPSNVEPFSLGFQDVSSSELKFLLSQGLDRNQKQAMQTILDSVDVEAGLSFDDLRSSAEEADEIHHTTAKKLKRNINVLENSEVISNRYRKDIVQVVKNGNAFGLGMQGFSRLSLADYYLMEFLAKKCFQSLIDARFDNSLSRPLFTVFSEAHRLMPDNSDSILADLVKDVYTFDQRRADIPSVMDTQLPSQLSRQVLEEINHAFIGCDRNGKSLPKSEWKTVLSLMNVVSNPQRENRLWMNKIQQLGHRDFLYVNASMTDPSDAPIVRFLAPRTSNP